MSLFLIWSNASGICCCMLLFAHTSAHIFTIDKIVFPLGMVFSPIEASFPHGLAFNLAFYHPVANFLPCVGNSSSLESKQKVLCADLD